MRLAALASLLLLGLSGCYGCPGDPDTGWSANRPRCMPCEGCCSMIPDPVVFGRVAHSTCAPDLPGALRARVRHNDFPLPGTNALSCPGPIVHLEGAGPAAQR